MMKYTGLCYKCECDLDEDYHEYDGKYYCENCCPQCEVERWYGLTPAFGVLSIAAHFVPTHLTPIAYREKFGDVPTTAEEVLAWHNEVLCSEQTN